MSQPATPHFAVRIEDERRDEAASDELADIVCEVTGKYLYEGFDYHEGKLIADAILAAGYKKGAGDE
jgi:hypothetical protein